ncbi:hypothetical protein LIER_26785 [Lithospermum erythrorhizon]|uniref:Uncharacterized protein n=1 Tax=Lithospermum erythrorhizon TaxID=34254 RepID=A0AAV3RBP1_LITER
MVKLGAGGVDSPKENEEDDDIVVVSSTDKPDEAIDLEELERLVEEKKTAKKGKGKAKRHSKVKSSGNVQKKRKGVVISEPSQGKNLDNFIVDDVEDVEGEDITGAVRRRRDWPTLAEYCERVHLKCSICVANRGTIASFFLESEELDFGRVIFDQIVDHARTGAKLKPIGFPSLICSILIPQHPGVLKAEDGPGEDVKPLTITDKLMIRKHVVDVHVKGVGQSEASPKGEAAALLIKIYEEKKGRVAELQAKIQALKTTVQPAVNDPVIIDVIEPDVVPPTINDPASDAADDLAETSPSHV